MSDLSHDAIMKYIRLVIGGGGGNTIDKEEEEELDNGYLLLNYHWQKHMGDLEFNEENFPDINKTIT